MWNINNDPSGYCSLRLNGNSLKKIFLLLGITTTDSVPATCFLGKQVKRNNIVSHFLISKNVFINRILEINNVKKDKKEQRQIFSALFSSKKIESIKVSFEDCDQITEDMV